MDKLVLHGFDQVDAARLRESVTDQLRASLSSNPEGFRAADLELVETERFAAAGLRGPALAHLIASSVDGALRR